MAYQPQLNGKDVPAAPSTDPPPSTGSGLQPSHALPPIIECNVADRQWSVTLHFASSDHMTDWLRWFKYITRHRKTKRPNYKNGHAAP